MSYDDCPVTSEANLRVQSHGKTGSPLRADSILSPSNQETFEVVLARLETDANTLEVWIDRLRQWLSAEVTRPLLSSVQTAHLVSLCAPRGRDMPHCQGRQADIALPVNSFGTVSLNYTEAVKRIDWLSFLGHRCDLTIRCAQSSGHQPSHN